MPTLQTYLVEDSLLIQKSLVTTLEELTPVAVVGMAQDERTAVAWLANPTHPVDLVIIDIFLKGGSGLGVLKSLKALNSRAKLVVLTNYATSDMRRKCLELGANKVFDKSNDIDTLIQYCNQLAVPGDGENGSEGDAGVLPRGIPP
jgi:DNA-binding NarL/FixJ family response regulator